MKQTAAKFIRYRRSLAALSLGAALFAAVAPTAAAQDTVSTHSEVEAQQNTEVEHVGQLGGQGNPRGPRQDMKLVRPGALLFASFDENKDGIVIASEIETGAAKAFDFADTDADGFLGGFEQGAWATAVGGAHGVLSNTMLFDADLDRSVTKTEFIAGIVRLAETYQLTTDGNVHFGDLIRSPGNRPRQEREQRPEPSRLSAN